VPTFFKYFLGKQFVGSGVFVSWIALGYAFKGMYLMVVNYIFYVEKTQILAMVTFLTAGINCILNYMFIGHYGAIGAAQATTIVYFINFLLVWYLSAKVYPMPWNLVSNQKKVNRKDENT
jgi:O-antigen/teichoic acid export membrane protein